MRALVVLLAVATSSCQADLMRRALRPPADLVCHDGAPVRVLTDPSCPHDICGWSCAPDRWWPR